MKSHKAYDSWVALWGKTKQTNCVLSLRTPAFLLYGKYTEMETHRLRLR